MMEVGRTSDALVVVEGVLLLTVEEEI